MAQIGRKKKAAQEAKAVSSGREMTKRRMRRNRRNIVKHSHTEKAKR